MRNAGLSALGRFTTTVADLTMMFWPSGGQGTSRRNAWASMVSDNVKSRARSEAEAAVTIAASRFLSEQVRRELTVSQA